MITLYLYPKLFGLPDNNPFGLKVDTFLKLAKLSYQVEYLIDSSQAPRKQLPYLKDGDKIVYDSNKMIDYLTQTYQLKIDEDLTDIQKNLSLLVKRMLDEHLYWIMSYSRWQDERFWPFFRDEFLKNFPKIAANDLEKARSYNIKKYQFQGIGRYQPEEIYCAGIDDLTAISQLLGKQPYIFGKKIHSLDACIYGFLANIYYFEIDTPLKQFLVSTKTLAVYCDRMRKYIENGV